MASRYQQMWRTVECNCGVRLTVRRTVDSKFGVRLSASVAYG